MFTNHHPFPDKRYPLMNISPSYSTQHNSLYISRTSHNPTSRRCVTQMLYLYSKTFSALLCTSNWYIMYFNITIQNRRHRINFVIYIVAHIVVLYAELSVCIITICIDRWLGGLGVLYGVV